MSTTFFCFITLHANRPLAYFGIICLYKSAKTTKRIHLDNRLLFDKKIFEKCVGHKRSHGFHATSSKIVLFPYDVRVYTVLPLIGLIAATVPQKNCFVRYSRKNKQPQIKGSDNYCTSRVQILQIPSCEKSRLCLAQYITKDKGWLEPYSSTNIDPLIGKAVLETNAPVLGHLFH